MCNFDCHCNCHTIITVGPDKRFIPSSPRNWVLHHNHDKLETKMNNNRCINNLCTSDHRSAVAPPLTPAVAPSTGMICRPHLCLSNINHNSVFWPKSPVTVFGAKKQYSTRGWWIEYSWGKTLSLLLKNYLQTPLWCCLSWEPFFLTAFYLETCQQVIKCRLTYFLLHLDKYNYVISVNVFQLTLLWNWYAPTCLMMV